MLNLEELDLMKDHLIGKYFSPADVADSESRYNAAKIYTANDCSSILKYIDTKSALDTKNVAPHTVNRIISEYSGIDGNVIPLTLTDVGAHGSKISAAIE